MNQTSDRFMLDAEDGVRVLRRGTGWGWHCRYCDMFSREVATPRTAQKEAANHLKAKGHGLLSKRVSELRGGG